MRALLFATAILLVACQSPQESTPAPATEAAPLVLTGEITRADHQTYREIPFSVPAGAGRLSIDFDYTGRDQKTVIDIGVRDPQGQRGWSGGNKSHIEIGANSATPSYRPGPLQPGEWTLVLGIPNIRDGQTADYTATARFTADTPAPKRPPPTYNPVALSAKPGWFRGDLHMHTAHSDGSCEVNGARGPCPAIETFNAAREAGLDFVAITDHNTITQLADIAAAQPSFPKTLLIPGTEVTTFFGHANVIGNTDFVDFQLGSPRLPTLAKLYDEVAAQGAILSINHPGLPSGEICMGCGWRGAETDWSRVTAMEVVNGGTLRTSGAESPMGGIALWDSLLKQGFHITAIAGSDNHDATDRTGAKQSPVGTPATVIFAQELSARGILDGIRSGRAFLDVAGLPGATLDMNVYGEGPKAANIQMGGEVQLSGGQSRVFTVWIENAPSGSNLKFAGSDVEVSGMTPITSPAGSKLNPVIGNARLTPGAEHGYIRPEIRDASGKLLLLGNPIYFRRAPR